MGTRAAQHFSFSQTSTRVSILKGNSRLILTIFCIVIDIGWSNFTVIVYSDDE